MVRLVRRKLREIRYYSAPRRRTAWGRVYEASLIVAVVLAPLGVFLSERYVVSTDVIAIVNGRLGRSEFGRLEAWTIATEPAGTPWRHPRPHGEFIASVTRERRGLFTHSTIITHPPDITLRRFTEAKPIPGLPPDAPESPLVLEALQREGPPALRRVRTDPDVDRSVPAWLLAATGWWVVLAVAFGIALFLVRIAVFLATDVKADRDDKLRRQNKCVNCGYNLRGLEFNANCPECGVLLD